MRTRLLAATLVLGLASPALAESPTGSFALRAGPAKGFSLIAEARRADEEAGVGRFERTTAVVGLGFAADGFSARAAIGSFGWSFAGAGEGTATLVTASLAHRTPGVAGGALSLELRHSYLLDPNGQLAITEPRIGWSLKF
jgi:hypothetical protein